MDETTISFEHEVAQLVLRYAAGRVTKDQALRWLLDRRDAVVYPTIDAIIQSQTLWVSVQPRLEPRAGGTGGDAVYHRSWT